MINVIALTQFAFLTLSIVFLKIMIHANSDLRVSEYLQTLDSIALWLFVIPVAWIAFASVCSRINRAPLTPRIAYGLGIFLAVLCFVFLATVTLLPTLDRAEFFKNLAKTLQRSPGATSRLSTITSCHSLCA
jgi:hypothetical protein